MSTISSKKCFVIAPIGAAESDIRKYSDKVLRFLIRHSMEPLGYEVVRADEISEPGAITFQIIRELVKADLVVADLTSTNPNVMYELAIRHAVRKPTILMMQAGERLPFDINTERTIFFDISDIENIEAARNELAEQARAIERNRFEVETPFSLVQDIAAQESSGKPLDRSLAAIQEEIANLRTAVSSISIREKAFESLEPRVRSRKEDAGTLSGRALDQDSS